VPYTEKGKTILRQMAKTDKSKAKATSVLHAMVNAKKMKGVEPK